MGPGSERMGPGSERMGPGSERMGPTPIPSTPGPTTPMPTTPMPNFAEPRSAYPPTLAITWDDEEHYGPLSASRNRELAVRASFDLMRRRPRDPSIDIPHRRGTSLEPELLVALPDDILKV